MSPTIIKKGMVDYNGVIYVPISSMEAIGDKHIVFQTLQTNVVSTVVPIERLLQSIWEFLEKHQKFRHKSLSDNYDHNMATDGHYTGALFLAVNAQRILWPSD